jgi:hypothetical protein
LGDSIIKIEVYYNNVCNGIIKQAYGLTPVKHTHIHRQKTEKIKVALWGFVFKNIIQTKTWLIVEHFFSLSLKYIYSMLK